MAKKKKPAPQRNTQVIMAVVCPPNSANPTAFSLGFHHGAEKARARKPESFIYPTTASAYALGYTAGCAAREAKKAAE
ncbi:MAG: hypothetical protein AB7U82_34835 [Blastocatellales bacterium]